MHLVIQPIACVLLLVAPDIDSVALNLVHLELSLVDRSIRKGQLTLSVLLTLEVCSFIYSTVWPGLEAEAMLLVISPATYIFCSVRVRICSSPVRFVVVPISLVNVTVCMVELAFTVCLTNRPLTLVARSVEPLLFALAISLRVKPFAFVDCSTFKFHRSLVHFYSLLVVEGFVTFVITLVWHAERLQRSGDFVIQSLVCNACVV